MGKDSSVSERIEKVREGAGLDKSKFSQTLGLNPKSYAELTGNRGAPPNLELVLGIVSTFNVNPTWLLCGTGPVYLPGNGPAASAAPQRPAAASGAGASGDTGCASAPPGMNETDWLRANVLREIGSLQLELQSLAESCARISKRIGKAIAMLDPAGPEEGVETLTGE